MSNNTDRQKQQQRRSSNESFVLDSGASGTYSGTYYPTAFDEESPNNGRSKITEQVIAEFKNKLEGLISAGALIQ